MPTRSVAHHHMSSQKVVYSDLRIGGNGDSGGGENERNRGAREAIRVAQLDPWSGILGPGMHGGNTSEIEADYLDPTSHWTEEDSDLELEGDRNVVDGTEVVHAISTGSGAGKDGLPSASLLASPIIDCDRDRYPFCIVWSPLPMITWLCPIIGHMGICDSRGVIWDFQGPYSIGRDDMAFGRPTRYLPLDPRLAKKFIKSGCACCDKNEGDAKKKKIASDKEVRALWDECVHFTNCHYSKRMHNICCQNCHHHTARAMNRMAYRGMTSWNQFHLAFWIFFCGKFRSVGAAICTFAPFCILMVFFLWIRYGLQM